MTLRGTMGRLGASDVRLGKSDRSELDVRAGNLERLGCASPRICLVQDLGDDGDASILRSHISLA
jgi:hypothetical protein